MSDGVESKWSGFLDVTVVCAKSGGQLIGGTVHAEGKLLIASPRRIVAWSSLPLGKPKVVATTAIAREMTGLIWAIARQVQPPLTG